MGDEWLGTQFQMSSDVQISYMPKYMKDIYDEVNRLGNLFKHMDADTYRGSIFYVHTYDDIMEISKTSPFYDFIKAELGIYIYHKRNIFQQYFKYKSKNIADPNEPVGLSGIILLLDTILKTFLPLKQPPSQMEQYTVASYDMLKTVIEDCKQ